MLGPVRVAVESSQVVSHRKTKQREICARRDERATMGVRLERAQFELRLLRHLESCGEPKRAVRCRIELKPTGDCDDEMMPSALLSFR